MSDKVKYYAVRTGLTPGVYTSWEECKAQVDGVSNAKYKSFKTHEEAMEFAGLANNTADKALDSSKEGIDEVLENLKADEAVAYVDGSFNAESGEYGLGVALFAKGEEIRFSEKGLDESLASMRNVAGEIKAAQKAMEEAIKLGIKELTIYHDYEGIAKWCLGEWKTNKEGTIAYKAFFDSIKDKLNVKFVKVKGHSGDKYNDLADKLAKSAIEIAT